MPAIIMLHGRSCSLGTIAACSMWTVTLRDRQECPSRLVCIIRWLVLDIILPLARFLIGSPADEWRAGQGATFVLVLFVLSRDSSPPPTIAGMEFACGTEQDEFGPVGHVLAWTRAQGSLPRLPVNPEGAKKRGLEAH